MYHLLQKEEIQSPQKEKTEEIKEEEQSEEKEKINDTEDINMETKSHHSIEQDRKEDSIPVEVQSRYMRMSLSEWTHS